MRYANAGKARTGAVPPGRELKRRGIILIVVLGVLTILVVLGTVFVSLTGIERATSQNYTYIVRAKMIARSGIERAVVELQQAALTRAYTDPSKDEWFYFGEDMNKNNQLDTGEDANKNGALDTSSFPVEFKEENKVNSSFKIPDKHYSGRLPGSYTPEGDYYLLKILDCSSMLNINTPYKPTLPGEPDTLARMLENLGKAIDPDNPPIAQGEGQQIINYRISLPNQSFVSKEQIKDTPGGIISDDDYKRIKDFITVYSWTDPSTIRLANGAVRPPAGTAQQGRPNYGAPYSTIESYVLAEPRSPININTAPWPVLVAALSDISGIYYEPTAGIYGTVKTVSVDFNAAKTIATEIIANRQKESSGLINGPFKTWNQFYRFCDNLGLSPAQAALLKANFNPNSDLNKFNPNASFNRMIDKFDVTRHSTEFCFGPTGYFEITSVGRIKSKTSDEAGYAKRYLLAEIKLESLVKVFDIWRDTTQADFYKGEISAVTDTALRTPKGQTFQLYPEPDVVWNGRNLPARCYYDGQAMLSTLDTPTQMGAYLSRAGFTGSLDLTDATADPKLYPDENGPMVNSVIDPQQLGDMFPDGCYSEKKKVAAYMAAGNVGPATGSISLWLKPNWKISSNHIFISMAIPPNAKSGYSGYYGGSTQLFHFMYYGYPYYGSNCLVFQFEGDWDANQWMIACPEVYNIFAQQNANKWIHLAITWNAYKISNYWPNAHRMYINGEFLSTSRVSSRYPYGGGGSVMDGTRGGNLLRIGERGDASFYYTPEGYPDGTLDEVTVYPNMEDDAFIMSLYRYGRYYPNGDGAFTSAPLTNTILSTYETGRLGAISWTEYNPFSTAESAFTFSIISEGKEEGNFNDPAGSAVGIPADGAYPPRYKFTCKTNGAPLLDTPVIDDVTITVLKKPIYLSWKVN